MDSSDSSDWSNSDDECLRRTMTGGRGQSWAEIARTAFPDGRHGTASCLQRWKDIAKPKSIKGPWSTNEDTTLSALVEELGAEKWVLIANRLGSRTGKQCRERWHNHLDPNIKRTPFTAEEDALIFELYAQIGSRWAEMARRLPGRPDNAIKNHFNTSLQRSKRRQSSASNSSLASSVNAAAFESASSSSSSSPASPITVPCSPRYSPYRTRQRTESNASSTLSISTSSYSNSQPAFPSPLSPIRSLSRSTSPAQSRTPSTTRKSNTPSFALTLGRDLDKDFFSPGRHSLSGFHINGPVTAPIGYHDQNYNFHLYEDRDEQKTPNHHHRGATTGHDPLWTSNILREDQELQELPGHFSSVAMQPSLSDFHYDYGYASSAALDSHGRLRTLTDWESLPDLVPSSYCSSQNMFANAPHKNNTAVRGIPPLTSHHLFHHDSAQDGEDSLPVLPPLNNSTFSNNIRVHHHQHRHNFNDGEQSQHLSMSYIPSSQISLYTEKDDEDADNHPHQRHRSAPQLHNNLEMTSHA